MVDLSRRLDDGQLNVAAACDMVLVVSDVGRNRAATRQVMTVLREAGIPFALVGRSDVDHAAYLLAGDFTAPQAEEMPPFPAEIDRDGAIDLTEDGGLLEYAAALLVDVPELRLEAVA